MRIAFFEIFMLTKLNNSQGLLLRAIVISGLND